MKTGFSAPPGRLRWHPVTVAGTIAVAVSAVAGAWLAAPGPGWWVGAAWLLLGCAAGFATSGST